MTQSTKFSGSTCPRCNSTCAVWPHMDDEMHCVICGATFYLERAERPVKRMPMAELPMEEEPIRRRAYEPEPERDAMVAEERRTTAVSRRRYGESIWDEMAGMEEFYRWNLRGA